MGKLLVVFSILLASASHSSGQGKFVSDIIKTRSGNLKISFIGHSSLMFEFNGKIIQIDPWSQLADYAKLPKADLILVTHHHQDHLDTNAIKLLSKSGTKIILTGAVFDIIKKGTVMKNGDTMSVEGIKIEAVPAYNITEGREKFHPKGRDNGYILNIGDKRIYIAGDTENIPEMASIKNIDIAFLPANQPYTMLPEQVADAAGKIKPKILYPYHYGDTDLSKLEKMLSKTGVEVRLRPLK